MSANLSIEIKLKGTKDELLEIIKCLKFFETDMQNQYREKRNCAYIHLTSLNHKVYLSNTTDKKIADYLDTCNGTIDIYASGPSGVYDDLEEVGLFEAMAVAAPGAWFKGEIFGNNGSGDLGCDAELKDGKLYLSEYFLDDADRPEYDDEDSDFDEDEYYEEVDKAKEDNTIDRIYDPLTKEYHIWRKN